MPSCVADEVDVVQGLGSGNPSYEHRFERNPVHAVAMSIDPTVLSARAQGAADQGLLVRFLSGEGQAREYLRWQSREEAQMGFRGVTSGTGCRGQGMVSRAKRIASVEACTGLR